MNKKDTLKEYYVNLQSMYTNVVNMLTAINQSLSTTASEVLVDIIDSDETKTTVRIPSFLYLENKLEQLQSNFNALFSIPETGEAWFNEASNMHKLQLVKSTSAPLKPIIDTNNIHIKSETNNFLKDLVNPKTFIRFDVTNLPDNINQMFVRKMVIYDKSVFDYINTLSDKSYERVSSVLFNKIKGSDYDEYDVLTNTPVKRDRYRSEFKILEIPKLDKGNPWTDFTENIHPHTRYQLRLDTINYRDTEDSTHEYTLQKGDYLCLQNKDVVYKVVNSETLKNTLDDYECLVVLEEVVGHIPLQITEENQNMVLQIYDNNYNEFHNVDVALEENPYIILFFGTVYNNVRSILSDGILLDLSTLKVKFDDGTELPYIDYYNKYCSNVGDLISGLALTAYPQLSNFTDHELRLLTDDIQITTAVTNALNQDTIKVVKINSHLTEDTITANLIKLHEEKSRINVDLVNVQDSIDRIYNQLITTDFSQELNISQIELQAKLSQYYQERTSLMTQKINIVDDINIYKSDVKGIANSKFRIRGVVDGTAINEYVKQIAGDKVDVISMDVEYKYASAKNDTVTVTTIDDTTFTSWNKYVNIEKERTLVFNNSNDTYDIKYVEYNSDANIIKWNQIDIPITQGEDVIIRVRFKLNIGQPFISLYTPWSDPRTVVFPNEYEENTEIKTIMSTNETDTNQAAFTKTLINDGYTEHVSNKMMEGSKVFWHDGNNIYSGFINSTNQMMSIKDKFDKIDDVVYEYKTLIDNTINAKYKVYISMDGILTEILPNVCNEITISDNIDNTTFIKKKFDIVIKNTGNVPINLYTMFFGDNQIPLIKNNNEHYDDYVSHYDKFIVNYGEDGDPNKSMKLQTYGQFIYFRTDNVNTYDTYYKEANINNFIDMMYENSSSENEKQMMYKKTSANAYKFDGQSLIYRSNEPLSSEVKFANDDNSEYYVVKYENIIIKTTEDSVVRINSKTDIADVSQEDFNLNSYDLEGSFITTSLNNSNQLLCNINSNDSQYKELRMNEVINIPMMIEYYLSTVDNTSKNIAFDIKPTVVSNPVNYVIKIKIVKEKETNTINN